MERAVHSLVWNRTFFRILYCLKDDPAAFKMKGRQVIGQNGICALHCYWDWDGGGIRMNMKIELFQDRRFMQVQPVL